jgi:hypothetical protein
MMFNKKGKFSFYLNDVKFSKIFFIFRTMATVRIPKARYVIWSNDMHFVAILAKHRKFIK